MSCSLNGSAVGSDAIGINRGNSTSLPECDAVFFLFNFDANAIAMDCLTGRLLCEFVSVLLDLLGDDDVSASVVAVLFFILNVFTKMKEEFYISFCYNGWSGMSQTNLCAHLSSASAVVRSS